MTTIASPHAKKLTSINSQMFWKSNSNSHPLTPFSEKLQKLLKNVLGLKTTSRFEEQTQSSLLLHPFFGPVPCLVATKKVFHKR